MTVVRGAWSQSGALPRTAVPARLPLGLRRATGCLRLCRESLALWSGDQPEDEDGVQVLAVAVDDGDAAAAGLLGQQLDDAGLAARVGVRQATALRGVVLE